MPSFGLVSTLFDFVTFPASCSASCLPHRLGDDAGDDSSRMNSIAPAEDMQ
jgi:hypothetical protein